MAKSIKISLTTDPSVEEPEVIIKACSQSSDVDKIIHAIEQCMDEEYPRIMTYREDQCFLVDQWDIIRVYTENRKLFVCTESGTYEAKESLRELEEILKDDRFIRISRFEVVNLKKVSAFDLSISGTIRVQFLDGTETYVARRYVKSINDRLALKKKGGERRE